MRWKGLAGGLAVAVAFVTAGCGGSSSEGGDNTPESTEMRVLNILPPGQSQFFSTTGQAQGTASGNPDDFGEHVDDQREMYWRSEFKPGEFFDREGKTPAATPKAGVEIFRDAFGVPIIYGDTGFDVWYGAGYAIAQDRLFLMDAVRRLGRGNFAEMLGPGSVPADIQQRVLTYSEAEYRAQFEALPQFAKDAIEGYIAGANAWIAEVTADPSKLPAEYQLLSSTPEPFSAIDVLAGGTLIARTVSALGGTEFDNIAALKALEDEFGETKGRNIFQDVVWIDDRKATVTIPPEEATFPTNQATPPAEREAVFNARADWATDLPMSLATGDGTGDAPEPGPTDCQPTAPPTAQQAGGPGPTRLARTAPARAVAALQAFGRRLSGGSYAVSISPAKTADGSTLLVSGPQLGYAPTQLVELEIHGGGYDARGSTVPLLPTVGIGYGERTAWALTTPNSKTIDSFIEITDFSSGTPTYRHDGQTKEMRCRIEEVFYRQATDNGVPVGPATCKVEKRVCRTVHGPVVAQTEDGSMARTVQYATFGREAETIVGVLEWNRVDNLQDFTEAMSKVTWNENTTYADADGNIAFFQPGLYPRRDPKTDHRLPIPGTGEFDHERLLSFDEMPKVINPEQGFLVNWNNKPALGWVDNEGGDGTSQPAGPEHRANLWNALLENRDDIVFDDLIEMDKAIGRGDVRERAFRPLILSLRNNSDLMERERQALDMIASWNGDHYRDGINIENESAEDTAAATLFDVVVRGIRQELFGNGQCPEDKLPAQAELIRACAGDASPTPLPQAWYNRQTVLGRHVFDANVLDNLALRILLPESSSLGTRHDYKVGRSNSEIMLAGLRRALSALESEFGTQDLSAYRRVHPRNEVCSATGIIGPCLTMPFQDRGTWIHLVGFNVPQ